MVLLFSRNNVWLIQNLMGYTIDCIVTYGMRACSVAQSCLTLCNPPLSMGLSRQEH